MVKVKATSGRPAEGPELTEREVEAARAIVRRAAPSPGGLRQGRFRRGAEMISRSLIERDEEVRLMFVALLCQEHVLLVGPPGVAKSLLCRLLAEWMGGAKLWQWQFTRFTEPGEVLGPVSIKALKEGRQERLPAGKLPEADVAFLDEVFKSNSAVLNGLLTVLNERECDLGAGRVKVPLRFAMGASNEWPESREELGALFDRFLFRKVVSPIKSPSGLKRLVADATVGAAPTESVTASELDAAHKEAMALPFPDASVEAFFAVVAELRKQGVTFYDRRVKKAFSAARAAAWLDGSPEVQPRHLAVLAHVLWEDPSEQRAKAGEVVLKLCNPAAYEVSQAVREAEDALAAMDRSNLASVSATTTKLTSIGVQRLAQHKGTPEADRACEWLRAEIRALRIEAVGSAAPGQF